MTFTELLNLLLGKGLDFFVAGVLIWVCVTLNWLKKSLEKHEEQCAENWRQNAEQWRQNQEAIRQLTANTAHIGGKMDAALSDKAQ